MSEAPTASDQTQAPTYAPGMPVWVDLASPDVSVARAFYEGLFGWNSLVTPAPQAGGYTMFMIDEQYVGAAGPTQSPEQPAAWMTYFATADVDATAHAVTEAGGKVIAPPMDVMDAGRMAVFTDPAGAFFAAWQAGVHAGFGAVISGPNSYCWTELHSTDIDGAKSFYQRVFGWDHQSNPFGGMTYTQWQVDGTTIGGGMAQGPETLPGVPPHWQVYFSVDNIDTAVARARELGAQVLHGPDSIEGTGRMAVVADPQGAVFALLQPLPQQP